VLGVGTMQKLMETDVLIVGLRGVGAETAKNVILAGPRSVTLHDENPVEVSDLAAQFYLSEKHIGQPRAASCVGKFVELNRFVSV